VPCVTLYQRTVFVFHWLLVHASLKGADVQMTQRFRNVLLCSKAQVQNKHRCACNLDAKKIMY